MAPRRGMVPGETDYTLHTWRLVPRLWIGQIESRHSFYLFSFNQMQIMKRISRLFICWNSWKKNVKLCLGIVSPTVEFWNNDSYVWMTIGNGNMADYSIMRPCTGALVVYIVGKSNGINLQLGMCSTFKVSVFVILMRLVSVRFWTLK